MQLEFNNRKAGMDEEMSRRAERLLRFSLSRFDGAVTRAKVTFFDMNGPKGGLDKRCRISAKLKTTGQIMVQNDGHDYTEALCLCLDKLVRAIRRNIDMKRSKTIRKNRMPLIFYIENSIQTRPDRQADHYK